MTRDEIRLRNEGRKDATERNRRNRANKKKRDTYGRPHPNSPEGRKAAEQVAKLVAAATLPEPSDE